MSVERLFALLTDRGTRTTLIPGNTLTASQPPVLIWGIVVERRATAVEDGEEIEWDVNTGDTIVTITDAVDSLDPHITHDDTTGTLEDAVPTAGDRVLLIVTADGTLTMLGKIEGVT